MEQQLSSAPRWTITQPWRGLFGLAVTLGYAVTVTSIFDLKTFNGFFSLLAQSFVPCLVMVGMGWRGQYPSTQGISQPWRGMLLTTFVALFGTLICFAVLNFLGAGVPHPFTQLYTIVCIITVFFLVMGFGSWPFSSLSLGASGWLTLILVYVVGWLAVHLFNFSLLSFPTGVFPSPIHAVPFYAKGGPFAPFAALVPNGPFRWESAITCGIWMATFLFSFAALDMWPFHKSSGLMKQPVLGIVLVVVCFVLALIAMGIGVYSMKIEPLRFTLYGICFIYGILLIMIIFKMWPGRALPPPVGGFVNLLIAFVIAFIAYFAYKSFALWHFGEAALKYPNNIFVIANMMLGVTFPAWACYSDLWDFWPLPPSPAPPGGPPPEGK